MANLSVLSYCQNLHKYLLDTVVTDKHGQVVPLADGAANAVDMILAVGSASGKIMLAGNGGSASTVSHMQADLCKAVGVRAMVFTEQPLLMALANDNGFETVFEWPIGLWVESDDLVVTVSSSGQSENILRGVRKSVERGCRVITLSGFSPDNALRKLGDLNFYVQSDVYGYVEMAHATLTHFMTDQAMGILKERSEGETGARDYSQDEKQ
jgi:D-sedoheptulose 7-phosphate isomerase